MASSETAKVGRRRREAQRRARLAERGIIPLTVLVPESGHVVIKDAASRMRDGADPREAARAVGGANQPPDSSADALAEAEAQLSEAGELVGQYARSLGAARRRAKAAEAELARIRAVPGILPRIARRLLRL